MKFNLIVKCFNKDQDMREAEVRPRHMDWEKEWWYRFWGQLCADTEADEEKDTNFEGEKEAKSKRVGWKNEKLLK